MKKVAQRIPGEGVVAMYHHRVGPGGVPPPMIVARSKAPRLLVQDDACPGILRHVGLHNLQRAIYAAVVGDNNLVVVECCSAAAITESIEP